MIMKRVENRGWAAIATVIACGLLIFACGINAKTVYVAKDGKSGNDGSSFSKGYDFSTALGKVSAGDTVLVQGGTHSVPNSGSKKNTFTIKCAGSSSKWIYIIAEKGKRATFDFQWKENSKYLTSSGSKITSHGFWFESSAKYLYFDRISITRAGYQGIFVTGSHITFENCLFYKNWNSGVEVNEGGSYVTLLNCDSYSNYDSKYKNGGMSDGFAVKQKVGPGCVMIGCRAWDNSDDGYDTYGASGDIVAFESSWAFNNGYDKGNGNGFKVGGDYKIQRNTVKNCIAFGNKEKGFDQNHNMGGITVLNCTAYKNGSNYGFGEKPTSGDKHTFKNNIAIDGKVDVQNATESNNSWSSGFSVSSSDFESLDLTKASVARSIDGTIPETKLFRLKKGSKLIDAGVDVGIPFSGSKPDLGAFEYEGTTDVVINKKNVKGSIGFTQSLQSNRLCVTFNSVFKDARVNVYTLSGIQVLGVSVKEKHSVSIDCSSLIYGVYVTELNIGGIKQHMQFTK